MVPCRSRVEHNLSTMSPPTRWAFLLGRRRFAALSASRSARRVHDEALPPCAVHCGRGHGHAHACDVAVRKSNAGQPRDEASSSCVSPSATSRGKAALNSASLVLRVSDRVPAFPAAVSVRDFAKPMWGTIQPRSAASTYAPQTSLGGAIHGHRPPLYHRPQPMEMGMPPELETLGNSDQPAIPQDGAGEEGPTTLSPHRQRATRGQRIRR